MIIESIVCAGLSCPPKTVTKPRLDYQTEAYIIEAVIADNDLAHMRRTYRAKLLITEDEATRFVRTLDRCLVIREALNLTPDLCGE